MQTLLEAASLLVANRVHRLPLIDRMGLNPTTPTEAESAQAQECCIAVMSQFKILRFIASNVRKSPPRVCFSPAYF